MKYYRFFMMILCMMVMKQVVAQNVGINTVFPLHTLDVNGDVNFRSGVLLNFSRGDSGATVMSRGSGNAPVWNKWQGFRLGAVSNQSLDLAAGFASPKQILFTNFGSSRFNIGTGYNTATSQYTVPEDGVYLLMASVVLSNPIAAQYRLNIQIPGSSGSFASSQVTVPSGSGIVILHTTITAYLESGTLLGVYVSSNTAHTVNTFNGAATFYSIVKL